MTVEFKTFKEWMLNQYEHDELANLCQHGAQNGFSELTYYDETTALYEKYHDDIWSMLYDDYQDSGLDSCLNLISKFNGAKHVASDEQYKNLLVWYAAEKIAREVTEGECSSDDACDDTSDTD